MDIYIDIPYLYRPSLCTWLSPYRVVNVRNCPGDVGSGSSVRYARIQLVAVSTSRRYFFGHPSTHFFGKRQSLYAHFHHKGPLRPSSKLTTFPSYSFPSHKPTSGHPPRQTPDPPCLFFSDKPPTDATHNGKFFTTFRSLKGEGDYTNSRMCSWSRQYDAEVISPCPHIETIFVGLPTIAVTHLSKLRGKHVMILVIDNLQTLIVPCRVDKSAKSTGRHDPITVCLPSTRAVGVGVLILWNSDWFLVTQIAGLPQLTIHRDSRMKAWQFDNENDVYDTTTNNIVRF